MVSDKSDRSLVVVELTGGNDCLNTVIPYYDELYYDNRPTVHHKQDEVLKLDDRLGLEPADGTHQEVVGRWQSRRHKRHRLPGTQPLPLQGDGHLAYCRTH